MGLPLPTDIALVDQAAATYIRNDPVVHDITTATRVFLTKADGYNIIAIEGTHDIAGWMADFLALGIWDHPAVEHPSLGWVHAGFFTLAMNVLPALQPIMASAPYAICGHSLGAALALLIGGTGIVEGYPPLKIAAFAPPRVGQSKFTTIINARPLFADRYGDDPVPTVPWPIPLFFPYRQVPLTRESPLVRGGTKCHAIANYVAAVHSRNQ